MRSPEHINFKDLKDNIAALKEVDGVADAIKAKDQELKDAGTEGGLGFDWPLKAIGVAKPLLIEQFAKAVEVAAEKELPLPDSVVMFYNENLSDDAKDPETPASNTPAGKAANKTPGSGGAKKGGGSPIPKGPASFDDIKKRTASPSNPTQVVDKCLLDGATAEEIIAAANAKATEMGRKEWTVATVKSHVAFRKKQGWEINEEEGKYTCTGYTPKNPPKKDKDAA